MKLQPLSLAVATAVSIGIVWAICSAVVMGAPGMAMYAAEGMMHFGPGTMPMHITANGFLVGLVIWSVGSGVTAWLVAVIYNALAGRQTRTEA